MNSLFIPREGLVRKLLKPNPNSTQLKATLSN